MPWLRVPSGVAADASHSDTVNSMVTPSTKELTSLAQRPDLNESMEHDERLANAIHGHQEANRPGTKVLRDLAPQCLAR